MEISEQEWLYRIALTKISGIGPVQSRRLIDTFGTASNVFQQKIKQLSAVDNIGMQTATAVKTFKDFSPIEAEIRFIQKHHVEPLFITDPNYPQRLLNCYDAPILLYYKGCVPLHTMKCISIIGTRRNSDYGQKCTEMIAEKLAGHNATIVSGLAFGIDAIAHKAALQFNTSTVGVLAHGLKEIYPSEHSTLAKNMCGNGGLLTEFTSDVSAERFNFPRRNRIVAGLSEATIVIETGMKGGSMITAELANGYNRDVFAVPGKIGDAKSAGCNYLIRTNKAILLDDPDELIEMLGWKSKQKKPPQQKQLFIQLTDDEKKITDSLTRKEPQHIDELLLSSQLSNSQFAAAMLSLELQNVVGVMPGKMYRMKG